MVLAGNAGKGSARQVPDVESFVEPDNSATTEASVQIEILIGGKSGVPAAHLDHVDGSKRPQGTPFQQTRWRLHVDIDPGPWPSGG